MGNLLIIFFALLFCIAPYFAAKWTFEGQEEYFKENNKIFEDIIELDTFKSNKILNKQLIEEKIEKDIIQNLVDRCKACEFATCENCDINWTEVQAINSYISKLEKVIDLMAEDRSEISEPKVSKEAIIDFYYKKVEEENE